MRILLSNDDGYFAPGLEHLAAALAKHAEITVVAPERDRSGASNSLTLDRPLMVRRAANGFLFVNGTPSSALTWTFTSLSSTTDDVDFSNDGGTTWTYVPVPDANGYDAAVTHLRLRPKGTMPGNGGGDPWFELRFRVTVN